MAFLICCWTVLLFSTGRLLRWHSCGPPGLFHHSSFILHPFPVGQLFEVRGEGGQVGQGFLVSLPSAFFILPSSFAQQEHLRVVVRGGEERVELERVLAMRTGGEDFGMRSAECGMTLDGSNHGRRRRELLAAHGIARLLEIGGGENGRGICKD